MDGQLGSWVFVGEFDEFIKGHVQTHKSTTRLCNCAELKEENIKCRTALAFLRASFTLASFFRNFVSKRSVWARISSFAALAAAF